MPEYQKMYAILCGAISDALDNLNNKAKARMILEEALLETEDMYIETARDAISINFKQTPARY